MKRKVAMLVEPKKFEIFEEEIPAVGDDDILLKVVSSGLCHSDVPNYLGTAEPRRTVLATRAAAKNFTIPCALGTSRLAR